MKSTLTRLVSDTRVMALPDLGPSVLFIRQKYESLGSTKVDAIELPIARWRMSTALYVTDIVTLLVFKNSANCLGFRL